MEPDIIAHMKYIKVFLLLFRLSSSVLHHHHPFCGEVTVMSKMTTVVEEETTAAALSIVFLATIRTSMIGICGLWEDKRVTWESFT